MIVARSLAIDSSWTTWPSRSVPRVVPRPWGMLRVATSAAEGIHAPLGGDPSGGSLRRDFYSSAAFLCGDRRALHAIIDPSWERGGARRAVCARARRNE